MILLPYLILAHLLGDFVFQPTRLVMWKIKSKKGVLVHVLVHFFTMIVILSPFIWVGYYEVILAALGISFIHFWIDEAKINFDLKHDTKVLPFLIDQLLHITTIAIAVAFMSSFTFIFPKTTVFAIYTDINTINFVSFLVFASSVIEIYKFQKKREKDKNARLQVKTSKMLSRVMIFTILYAFFIIIFSAINY